MKFEVLADALADVKMTRPDKGRVLYDAVIEKRPERILELGFHQGVSTCYLAGALDELGRGSIVTMDRQSARKHEPDISANLARFDLGSYVTPVFALRSFTWELAKLIRDGVDRPFDLVFHDGGHNWDVAGYSFFLTDKLCGPGAWMLFDDLNWTHQSASMADSGLAKQMSDDERSAPHVSMVYELLVKQHPDYGDFSFTYKGGMGWARKTAGAPSLKPPPVSERLRTEVGNAVGRTRAVAGRTRTAARTTSRRATRKLRSMAGRS